MMISLTELQARLTDGMYCIIMFEFVILLLVIILMLVLWFDVVKGDLEMKKLMEKLSRIEMKLAE